MSNIIGSDLEYASGAVTMRGYFAIAAEGPARRPGVLIVHDAFGLDAFCIDVADRLARMGFAALAIDLWGDRRQFLHAEEDVKGHIAALLADRDMWMGRVEAARRALAAQPGVDGMRIAAIGYCLGGSTVLEFARSGGDVLGVVSFHGGLDLVGRDWDGGAVHARLLVCTGAEDPLVPPAAVTAFQDDVRAGGMTWELAVYSGARHAFTRPDAAARSTPDRSGYDARADRRSWRAMAWAAVIASRIAAA